jgi:hypothetical protein
MGPATAAAELQITPPNAMAPCEIMITVAFTRPRAQLGITRCAATQSSEADNGLMLEFAQQNQAKAVTQSVALPAPEN